MRIDSDQFEDMVERVKVGDTVSFIHTNVFPVRLKKKVTKIFRNHRGERVFFVSDTDGLIEVDALLFEESEFTTTGEAES